MYTQLKLSWKRIRTCQKSTESIQELDMQQYCSWNFTTKVMQTSNIKFSATTSTWLVLRSSSSKSKAKRYCKQLTCLILLESSRLRWNCFILILSKLFMIFQWGQNHMKNWFMDLLRCNCLSPMFSFYQSRTLLPKTVWFKNQPYLRT